MAELLPFVKRVWHCTLLFFPQCAIATLAQNVYKGLLQQRRYLEADLQWLSIKPGKIVYYLWQEADQEFKHIIPYNDLIEGDLTGVYQPPLTSNIVAHCLSPSPTIAQSFLPPALRQRAVPSPVPQHIPTPPPHGNNNTTTRTTGTGGRAPGGTTGRGGTNTSGRGAGNSGGRPGTQVNPQFHPNFQAFWASVPATRQNEGIGRWLTAANSNTTQLLDLLRLTSTNCGRFHTRGACELQNCHQRHVPKTLDPRQVDSAVALFHAGMQQAR
jgi:hypothetical protein